MGAYLNVHPALQHFSFPSQECLQLTPNHFNVCTLASPQAISQTMSSLSIVS